MNAKKLSTKQENSLPEGKDPSEMTSEERKKIKIEFAPGAFDNFDGTQEELNELMENIQKAILSGELFENSKPVDIDELLESDDPDDWALAEHLINALNSEDQDRKLQ